MRIRRLELVDFRNYEHFEIEPSEDLTILVGPNAVGKTNVIEAIEMVTSARSFRKPRWEEVVRWGASRAAVRIEASGADQLLETRLTLAADGKREYAVNGRVRRRIADVAGLVPCVLFTPEDLALVKGPAETRRGSIDALGEQLSATYASLKRDYERVVRSRNRLLKDGAPAEEVSVWSEQVASMGSRLLMHRVRLLSRMSRHVGRIYADLADGETLEVGYECRSGLSGAECESADQDAIAARIAEELARRSGEEATRQVTLAGPHRDDISFKVAGREARAYASQGQQRTVAIAWKLAEVLVIEEVAKRTPILLLDDVMSELDAIRRHALTDVVQRHVQTFLTTTNLDYFDDSLLGAAKIVPLERRRVDGAG